MECCVTNDEKKGFPKDFPRDSIFAQISLEGGVFTVLGAEKRNTSGFQLALL
jgi:hypothetical protein